MRKIAALHRALLCLSGSACAHRRLTQRVADGFTIQLCQFDIDDSRWQRFSRCVRGCSKANRRRWLEAAHLASALCFFGAELTIACERSACALSLTHSSDSTAPACPKMLVAAGLSAGTTPNSLLGDSVSRMEANKALPLPAAICLRGEWKMGASLQENRHAMC